MKKTLLMVFLVLCSTVVFSALNDDVALCIDFDEDSTYFRDTVSNYNFTSNNTARVPDPIDFGRETQDNNDDIVKADSNELDLTSTYSIGLLVNVTAVVTTSILWDCRAGNNLIMFGTDNDFSISQGEEVLFLGAMTALNNNEWQWMTIVINATDSTLYINGTVFGVDTDTPIPAFTNCRNTFLNRFNPSGADQEWKQSLGQAVAWNRTLTPADALLYYNSGDGVSCANDLAPPPPPINNTPPTHDNPIINVTDNPINSTLGNITVFNQSTADADGDLVKNIIDFRISDISITKLNIPFESGSTALITKDYSSFNEPLSVSGATFNSTGGFDGRGAYEFDGVDDEITGNFSEPINISDFSISAWFKTAHDTIASEFIWGNDGQGTSTESDLFITSSGQIRSRSNGSTIISDSGFDDEQWHFVVVTFDRDSFGQAYLDGVASGSAVNISGVQNNITTTTFTIGARSSGNFFNGSIDEFKIYSRALSAQQVLQLFKNNTDLIVSGETNVSEIWSACITPDDGIDNGSTKCSNTVLINAFPSVSIISPSPPHTENGTSFIMGFNISGINANCDLYRNTTIVNSTAAIEGANTTISDSIADILISQTINYTINCSVGNSFITDSIIIDIDRENPIINITSPQNNFITNETFDFNISCADPNLLEFEGQIIGDNGSGNVVQSFSFVNLSVAEIFFTDTFNGSPDFYEVSVNCSDGHTANDISGLVAVQTGNDIAYSYNGNWITETFVSSSESINKLSYIRESDRIITYNEFDRKMVSLSDSWITKRVYCSMPFKKVPKSSYTGHVVCGQMWYDTVSDARSSVSWIDDYAFDVTYTTKQPSFYTKSVGIINTNSASSFFTFDNESPTINFLTANNTVFSLGNNNILFNVTDLFDTLTCTLEEDRDNNGIFETLTTTPSSIVNGGESFITTSLPNENTSFEYRVNCFDPVTNKGVSSVQTLIVTSTAPYELGLNSFFTKDFNIDTIPGIIFYILLIGLWILLVWLGDKWLNPAIMGFAFIWGIGLSVITMLRVSLLFGIVFMVLQFLIALRINRVDEIAEKRKNGQ